MDFGQSVRVLNDEVTGILGELWTVAHRLPFVNIFSILPYPEHPKYDFLVEALDEMEPLLDVARVDRGYMVALEGWTPLYQNLTGLVFSDLLTGRGAVRESAEFVCMQAKLVDGPGRRVLFKVLGAKSVTVILRPTHPISEWCRETDEEFTTRMDLEGCELQLFNEDHEQLQSLIAALDAAEKSIAHQNTLAVMAGDYLPFKDWAAWDPESGEVDLPASAKFRDLFHE